MDRNFFFVSIKKEFKIKWHFSTRHDKYNQLNDQTKKDKIDRYKKAGRKYKIETEKSTKASFR